jgi:hypothetical protein
MKYSVKLKVSFFKIILKNTQSFVIIDGTLTIGDFLNSTESFKNKLVDYGLKSEITDSIVKSQFRILNVSLNLQIIFLCKYCLLSLIDL